jgi:hypothetical protein
VPAVPDVPEYDSFFPYLPLMAVFGLPSSTKEPIRLTDARIFFSVFTLLIVLIALSLCREADESKVRTLQVLTILPTAALPLATGGDDMPVVALLLLAMVLAARRRPGWSGIVLGVASAMKFTAWPLALLALFAARDERGKRAPGRMALGMAAVVGPTVIPFFLLGAKAFVENVVLFPLGLIGVSSPAESPLPGHLLVAGFPALHRVVPLIVVVVGGSVLARRLWRHPPTTVSEVVWIGAWVMTVGIMFAPSTRVGYLLYPINFFVWARLFGGASVRSAAVGLDGQISGQSSSGSWTRRTLNRVTSRGPADPVEGAAAPAETPAGDPAPGTEVPADGPPVVVRSGAAPGNVVGETVVPTSQYQPSEPPF